MSDKHKCRDCQHLTENRKCAKRPMMELDGTTVPVFDWKEPGAIVWMIDVLHECDNFLPDIKFNGGKYYESPNVSSEDLGEEDTVVEGGPFLVAEGTCFNCGKELKNPPILFLGHSDRLICVDCSQIDSDIRKGLDYLTSALDNLRGGALNLALGMIDLEIRKAVKNT